MLGSFVQQASFATLDQLVPRDLEHVFRPMEVRQRQPLLGHHRDSFFAGRWDWSLQRVVDAVVLPWQHGRLGKGEAPPAAAPAATDAAAHFPLGRHELRLVLAHWPMEELLPVRLVSRTWNKAVDELLQGYFGSGDAFWALIRADGPRPASWWPFYVAARVFKMQGEIQFLAGKHQGLAARVAELAETFNTQAVSVFSDMQRLAECRLRAQHWDATCAALRERHSRTRKAVMDLEDTVEQQLCQCAMLLKRTCHYVEISGPFRGRPWRDDPARPAVRQDMMAKEEPAMCRQLDEAVDVEARVPASPTTPATPSFQEWLTAVSAMAEAMHAAKRQLVQERDWISAAVQEQRHLLEVVLPARLAELQRACFAVQTGLSLLDCLQRELHSLEAATDELSKEWTTKEQLVRYYMSRGNEVSKEQCRTSSSRALYAEFQELKAKAEVIAQTMGVSFVPADVLKVAVKTVGVAAVPAAPPPSPTVVHVVCGEARTLLAVHLLRWPSHLAYPVDCSQTADWVIDRETEWMD